jgi:hypothetical protein
MSGQGYTFVQATTGIAGRLLTYSLALGLLMKDNSCLVGVPSTSWILQICSRKFLPGNMGLLLIISPSMQPALQMSNALLYPYKHTVSHITTFNFSHLSIEHDLRSSVPSRFHISPVWSWLGSDTRARPKSQIFRSQLELRRMLDGLRSLCRTLAECMYFRPRRI